MSSLCRGTLATCLTARTGYLQALQSSPKKPSSSKGPPSSVRSAGVLTLDALRKKTGLPTKERGKWPTFVSVLSLTPRTVVPIYDARPFFDGTRNYKEFKLKNVETLCELYSGQEVPLGALVGVLHSLGCYKRRETEDSTFGFAMNLYAVVIFATMQEGDDDQDADEDAE